MAVEVPKGSLRRRRAYALLVALAVAAFLALQLYPLGLQAVLLGRMMDVSASPAELTLYASNASLFCYPGVLEVRNLGGAGLAYSLNFSLDGRAAFFEVRSGNATLLVLPAGLSGRLDLAPDSSARLALCVKGPADPSLRLVAWDPRYPEATRLAVAIRVRGTDWWNNTFPRRIELAPVVAREGLALFEITADGTVYVNGKPVRKVSSLEGVEANGLAVVLKSGGARYLLPFQVESWAKRPDGVLYPASIKSGREQMWGYDRLVFSAYLTNGSRIEIYLGGRLTANFTGGVEARGGTVVFGSERATLNEWGFFGEGWGVNLSGYIVYPYQVRRIEYSDAGTWRRLVSGPARTVYWFNTSGFSDYRIESAVAFWGRGVNATQMYVWPSVDFRGIILEWVSPIIYMGKGWTMSFDCGTTCSSLPVKVLPGNETRVQLCRDFFTPGGARYGYFHIALVKAPLAEIKSMAATFSSFPGG